MEKFFKLKENGTNVSTEVMAGITTFMTMAYILIVNPNILADAGMDPGGVFTATALAACIGTVMMALLANYPFAMAPGMGLNAYFAYTVAQEYGWQVALLAVFVEGLIFILLSLVNVREALFNAIPQTLKLGATAGIGLFIAFVGLQNAGIVANSDATLVTFGDIRDIRVILALVGVVITMCFMAKKVKGALLWGILATYGLGVACQLTGLYAPNPEAGIYSLYPAGIVQLPPSLSEVNLFTALGSGSFTGLNLLNFAVVVFAFLFVDVFDTIGTLIGVSLKAGFLDKDNKLPKAKQALLADAIGTTAGAMCGTSTVTTYIESASGVAEGGRTGLTALVTAGLFFLALFFSPLFAVIPSFATAPALIIVGAMMAEVITKIDFSDFTEGFPAFIAILMMPLAYSISDGLIFGVLSYVLIKVLTGKSKSVTAVMYVIAALFLAALVLRNG